MTNEQIKAAADAHAATYGPEGSQDYIMALHHFNITAEWFAASQLGEGGYSREQVRDAMHWMWEGGEVFNHWEAGQAIAKYIDNLASLPVAPQPSAEAIVKATLEGLLTSVEAKKPTDDYEQYDLDFHSRSIRCTLSLLPEDAAPQPEVETVEQSGLLTEDQWLDKITAELKAEHGIDTSEWEYKYGDCCFSAAEFLARAFEDAAPQHPNQEVVEALREILEFADDAPVNDGEYYNEFRKTIIEMADAAIKDAALSATRSEAVEGQGVAPDVRALCVGAWPLTSVLEKLIEATEILLNKKDYDGHGWEEIYHAKQKAKVLLAATWEQIKQELAKKDAATPSPEAVVPVFESTGSKKGWYYAYNDAQGLNQHSEVFPTKDEAEQAYRVRFKAVVPAERQPDEWDAEITTKHLQDLDRLLDVQGYETWTFSRIAIKQALRLLAAPAPQVEKMREALTDASRRLKIVIKSPELFSDNVRLQIFCEQLDLTITAALS